MGRKLTFRQLRVEKGWPHSRQWTNKLVKKGKMPAPKRRPDGGLLNLWDEDEFDAYYTTFVSAYRAPISIALTECLVEALSSSSIDGIVVAINRLRAALESEGAAAGDVVVSLKASLRAPAPTRASSEASTITDTSCGSLGSRCWKQRKPGECASTVKAAGYRVTKPRKQRVGPTFVAEFADGADVSVHFAGKT
jgi:hypothetical protein